MSESDWLTSTDPQAMLAFLRDCGAVSERKLRLSAVACCRRIQHLMDDSRSIIVVDVAENYADGRQGEQALRQAHYGAVAVGEWRRGRVNHPACAAKLVAGPVSPEEGRLRIQFSVAPYTAFDAVTCSAREAVEAKAQVGEPAGIEQAAQANLIRDIFGNPFRPISFSPEWRTEAVVALARGIYEERAWDRMAVLGDALEEAGCTAPDVLEHCRWPNTHVRGCWVVDEALGRG